MGANEPAIAIGAGSKCWWWSRRRSDSVRPARLISRSRESSLHNSRKWTRRRNRALENPPSPVHDARHAGCTRLQSELKGCRAPSDVQRDPGIFKPSQQTQHFTFPSARALAGAAPHLGHCYQIRISLAAHWSSRAISVRRPSRQCLPAPQSTSKPPRSGRYSTRKVRHIHWSRDTADRRAVGVGLELDHSKLLLN